MIKSKKYPHGFTLIEMLVVVLIVGILAGIALPQYKIAVLKSKYATMKDIVRVVKEAEQRYYLLHNDYTMNFNELDVDFPGIYDNGTDGSNIKISGGYCSLNWWPSNKGIICVLDKIALSDAFKHFNKRCRARNVQEGQTNTVADRVCQAESGKSSPDKYENGSNYYLYER